MNVDPLADVAPDWTPYRYGFNNPVKYIDPDGLFESRSDAKGWANENNIKTGFFRNHKIRNHDDGSWSVDNRKEGVTYYRGSDLDDANVLGRRSDGVIETVLLSNKKYNAFTSTTSDIWNSSAGRMLVPDFMSIGVGFSGIVGVGGVTSFELNWLTRGPEASFLPIITMTQSLGAGYSLDATLNIGTSNYLGNVNNINRGMLQTNTIGNNKDFPSIWGSGGVSAIGKLGITGSYTPIEGSYGIIERQLNVGAGLPLGPLPANGAGGVSNTFILFSKK